MTAAMLKPEYANRWSRRERRQGRHLAKALRARYQKTFPQPNGVLSDIGGEAKTLLSAHNPYARTIWFRAVAGHLCHKLNAKPPKCIPEKPVYFLTVIDRTAVVVPEGEQGDRTGPSLKQIREIYWQHLKGLNFFGMIDPSLYVSTQRTHQVPRLIQFHVHALVWGIDETGLDEVCERIRARANTMVPGATPAEFSAVQDGDLRQVIWYTTKMPRKQYQLWRRASGRLKQYKRAINGVNAVRLLEEMRTTTLDQLALAGGEGVEILKRSLQDARRD